jgi:hypothetical protein
MCIEFEMFKVKVPSFFSVSCHAGMDVIYNLVEYSIVLRDFRLAGIWGKAEVEDGKEHFVLSTALHGKRRSLIETLKQVDKDRFVSVQPRQVLRREQGRPAGRALLTNRGHCHIRIQRPTMLHLTLHTPHWRGGSV